MNFCYLITDGDFYKIGVADFPERRLSDLQVGCPRNLSLIGSLPGGRAVETHFHRRLARFNVRGEWFDLPKRIRAVMERAFKESRLPKKLTRQAPEPPKVKPKRTDRNLVIRDFRDAKIKIYEAFTRTPKKVYRYFNVALPVNGKRIFKTFRNLDEAREFALEEWRRSPLRGKLYYENGVTNLAGYRASIKKAQ